MFAGMDVPAAYTHEPTEPQTSAPTIEPVEAADVEDVPERSLVRREHALPRLVARPR